MCFCLVWFILLILEEENERDRQTDIEHQCEREMMEPEMGVCALNRNQIPDPSAEGAMLQLIEQPSQLVFFLKKTALSGQLSLVRLPVNIPIPSQDTYKNQSVHQ